MQYYTSIRPGRSKGDPFVTDVRQFIYRESGVTQYKLRHTGQWCDLPRTAKVPNVTTTTTQLYSEPPKIKLSKFKDLQELKAVIPRDYQTFYDNLLQMQLSQN